MGSQKNILQVLPCGFTAQASGAAVLTVATLPVGELAFFDKYNAIQTSGAGRFVLRISATEIL